MKTFNTTGLCLPSKHYMVDMSECVSKIRKLVFEGKYFTINRARQFGKTTTLNALENSLRPDCHVLSLDFQAISAAGFKTEEAFVKAFCRTIWKKRNAASMPVQVQSEIREIMERREYPAVLDELFTVLSDWCAGADKPVVLIIDEVDSAANNQVFLDFLAQLRLQYLEREKDESYGAFASVILAGVTDIKHIKGKLRDEEQHIVNSPWNIAADFEIDMSLPEYGIRKMLDEYEKDHHMKMDTHQIAKLLRDYTNGYPFLVSRICQLIDVEVAEKMNLAAAWSHQGFDEAIKRILAEDNTLFQSMFGKLNNYSLLKAALRSILMEGAKISYSPEQESIQQMQMYGFIQNDGGTARIANRIFETKLYNYFLSEEELRDNVFSREGDYAKNRFIEGGRLNMRKILEHFIITYTQIFGPLEEKFKEKDGREQFLLYLKPIINGTGNYYIEAQTRDQTRTDVIVDYLGHQYIVELKIWRGERYNADGEKQISEYLDHFGLSTGYMLSFNFNKKKETGVRQVHIGQKLLYEATL